MRENMDQTIPDESCGEKDSWVVEVEKSLDDETRPDESPDGLIHKVPESLLREDTKVFYLPQVISLGPYHFQKKEKLDDEMGLLKSEVARNVHRQIRGDLKSSEKVQNPSGLRSLMETFKVHEEEIKKRYAAKFEVAGEKCAWMITRDACLVLQVLERFRKDEDEDEDEDAEDSGSASIDRILSRERHHPLLTEIVKDMVMMENQLPFWTLKEIRPDIEDWFESALKNLSPIEVAKESNCLEYNRDSHILQLLHDYIVDNQRIHQSSPPGHHSGSTFIVIRFLSFAFESLDVWCSVFRCDLDEDYPLLLWRCIKWLFIVLVYGIILLVLSPVILIMFIIFAIEANRYLRWKIRKHVPTVEELRRVGVKFKKLEGLKKGISHINFKERNSTLYLPQFKVDNRTEVILRNLIALEICSQRKEKPITRYVILMNDLINTSEDVGILRREDIITSKLGSDEEIAKLWNSMVTSTGVPSYKPIDDAVSSIDRYRKKWWKVLWAQFIMIHCSKPWLFLSLLAGLLLLLLTIVQVVCLFASCQIR